MGISRQRLLPNDQVRCRIAREELLLTGLSREGNKVKRFEWCQEYQQDNFDDVIWTDESSIQLETHRRTCCRKIGQPPKPKPR